jgi:hypothetical protein
LLHGLYLSCQERFGIDTLTDLELQHLCDELYLEDADFQLDLINPATGKWTTKRHRLNQRGDEASEKSREESVASFGIVLSLRGGAWVISPMEKGEELLVVHMATLIRGAQRAMDNDKDKSNRAVQISIKTGVPHSKRYHRQIPDDWVRFLVGTGNIVNNEQTSTTVLEIARSTAECERSWQRKKNKMGWTASVVGQNKLEEEKYSYINSLHPRR